MLHQTDVSLHVPLPTMWCISFHSVPGMSRGFPGISIPVPLHKCRKCSGTFTGQTACVKGWALVRGNHIFAGASSIINPEYTLTLWAWGMAMISIWLPRPGLIQRGNGHRLPGQFGLFWQRGAQIWPKHLRFCSLRIRLASLSDGYIPKCSPKYNSCFGFFPVWAFTESEEYTIKIHHWKTAIECSRTHHWLS